MSDCMSVQVIWEDAEVREQRKVDAELLQMVDDGLLSMSIREDGEFVFWATPKGCVELGMTN